MTAPPSAWITRWAHLVPAGGKVLDVAAGSGRHSAFFAGRGHAVTALDRDASALAAVSMFARTLVADLEQAPWPLTGERFDAVIVTNYLFRPLFPALIESLAPGGDCAAFVRSHATRGSRRLMVVGHEPDLSELIAELLESAFEQDMQKAMVVGLRLSGEGPAELRFVLEPKGLLSTRA